MCFGQREDNGKHQHPVATAACTHDLSTHMHSHTHAHRGKFGEARHSNERTRASSSHSNTPLTHTQSHMGYTVYIHTLMHAHTHTRAHTHTHARTVANLVRYSNRLMRPSSSHMSSMAMKLWDSRASWRAFSRACV